MIPTEDSNATKTKHNNHTTKLNNWYLLNYLTLLNETRVLSYGLKHSVTPKQIPTEVIVSSVEAALSRQRELSESTKDNIRSRIASTLQSASQHLVSFCVVLWHTNCSSTWRQYYNRSPTNPDENYNPLRTSLTPLRFYRYLTTTK